MTYNREAWRAAHQNGKIPLNELRETDPAYYDPDLGRTGLLHPTAARALSAMLYAAACEGHEVRTKYTYRTLDKQWEKWWDYQNGGNLAAYPGTSNHGWAVASDLQWSTPAAIAWMHDNAARFGFKFDVPSENWHITYYKEGDVTPAVIAMEADMTKADEIEKGIEAFLADREPAAEGLARKTYRALTRAASKPLPGDHTHAPSDHTHTVEGTAS